MELSNILELIHAVSDSKLTQFNLQDGNLNISMSAEKTIVQQVAANADAAAGYAAAKCRSADISAERKHLEMLLRR